jgi:hypothetical protein
MASDVDLSGQPMADVAEELGFLLTVGTRLTNLSMRCVVGRTNGKSGLGDRLVLLATAAASRYSRRPSPLPTACLRPLLHKRGAD